MSYMSSYIPRTARVLKAGINIRSTKSIQYCYCRERKHQRNIRAMYQFSSPGTKACVVSTPGFDAIRRDSYREQPVADAITDLLQAASNKLAETLFIRDFTEQVIRGDHHDLEPYMINNQSSPSARQENCEAPMRKSWYISPY